MEDLGQPASYLILKQGAPVYASDGEQVGRVEEVRADQENDIFDGLVIVHGMLARGEHYVPADQVDEIYERGVVLRVDAAGVESLPAPD
jgi:uncharacterized protein YrrD